MYRLNKVGLKGQSCIAPFSQGMNSVRIFMAQYDCLFKDSVNLRWLFSPGNLNSKFSKTYI